MVRVVVRVGTEKNGGFPPLVRVVRVDRAVFVKSLYIAAAVTQPGQTFSVYLLSTLTTLTTLTKRGIR